jgi:hypothetical protein
LDAHQAAGQRAILHDHLSSEVHEPGARSGRQDCRRQKQKLCRGKPENAAVPPHSTETSPMRNA